MLTEAGLDYCPKRISLDINHVDEQNTEDFVSSKRIRFFRIVEIFSTSLEKEQCVWKEYEDYKASKNIVHAMRQCETKFSNNTL